MNSVDDIIYDEIKYNIIYVTIGAISLKENNYNIPKKNFTIKNGHNDLNKKILKHNFLCRIYVSNEDNNYFKYAHGNYYNDNPNKYNLNDKEIKELIEKMNNIINLIYDDVKCFRSKYFKKKLFNNIEQPEINALIIALKKDILKKIIKSNLLLLSNNKIREIKIEQIFNKNN